jgi:hypothetical protein
MNGDRRFELPDGLTTEEERAIVTALERYFVHEDPRPTPWVLAGRLDATGWGALQCRRYSEGSWALGGRHAFLRPGVGPMQGRGDAA